MMKQNSVYVLVAVLLVSCTSTKTTSTTTTTTSNVTTAPLATLASASILGDWDYIVTDTPDGDFKGVLTILSSAGAFEAKMISGTSVTPVEKFLFIKEKNKITGEVPYNGMTVGLDADMAGDQLKGTMFAGGMTFPFTAIRKN